MLWSINSCQNRASADQYHLAISQSQVSTHWGRVFFEVIRWQVTSFQRVAGSSLFSKKFIWNMLWLCHYDSPWSRIGHALRPIFMLWLVKIFKVSSCGKLCIVLKLVYFDSWSWQSFVSTCDFFNCLFPLDVQNEKQLLSRVFVFVFHFAWCVRGFKSLKRFWSYLIAFRSCISNGKPEQLLYLIQTLTTKDCKGPQTNMPENVGSIKTWSSVDLL